MFILALAFGMTIRTAYRVKTTQMTHLRRRRADTPFRSKVDGVQDQTHPCPSPNMMPRSSKTLSPNVDDFCEGVKFCLSGTDLVGVTYERVEIGVD